MRRLKFSSEVRYSPVRAQLRRRVGKLDHRITEAVVGETGPPAFAFGDSRRGIVVGLEFAVEDVLGEPFRMGLFRLAVRREPFVVPDGEDGSGGGFDRDPAPAGQVFAEVGGDPVSRPVEPDRFEPAHHLTARRSLAGQDSSRRGGDHRAFPAGVVEAGKPPAGRFKPGVIGFAVAEPVEQQPAGGDSPRAVAGQKQFAVDFQLEPEFRIIPPRRLVEVPDLMGVAVVPAVAEHGAPGGAFSRNQPAGHVDFQKTDPTVENGNGRGQFAAVDPAAVEPEVAVTRRGDPHQRFAENSRAVEFPPQAGSGHYFTLKGQSGQIACDPARPAFRFD